MSIFKKFVKGNKDNQHTNNSNPSIHTNEEKSKSGRLEDQIKILNSYIQELAKENETLQQRNNDMKTTLIQNKQLLGIITLKSLLFRIDDYINNIGQTDQLVNKLKNEIDSLRSQLADKEEVYKPTNGGMTTKATTIYQTSPKNSAMTTYTNFENHLKSPRSNNNSQGTNSMLSLVCPQCKGYFKYNMPQIPSSRHNQSQEQLLKKQKELIDEINNLKFEMSSLINEQQSKHNLFQNDNGGDVYDDDDGAYSSQRSIQSYSRPSKVHTLSQMFIDKQSQGGNKDLKHIQEILDESTKLNELILFQDSRGEIWSIMKRPDLHPQDLIQDDAPNGNDEQVLNSYREEREFPQQNSNESGEEEYDEELENEEEEEEQVTSEQNEDLSYSKGQRQKAIMQLQSEISQQNSNQNLGKKSETHGKKEKSGKNGEDKNVIVSVLNTEEQEC